MGLRDQYCDGAARSGCPAYPARVSSSPAAIAHVSWDCWVFAPGAETPCPPTPLSVLAGPVPEGSDSVALIRLRGVQRRVLSHQWALACSGPRCPAFLWFDIPVGSRTCQPTETLGSPHPILLTALSEGNHCLMSSKSI